ncbi:MAG: AAA family ATPase, partial [Rhodocyclaceae bacterium]|nr:AAA family ATPase [Rhodocyclaceae bacterium]
FKRDETTGSPHLEALYEHWRPDAGRQREDQFSDGTLRLLGIMWSLLDGSSLLLLEEPELSLNEDIVRQIHALISRMQRNAKYRRQVFVTTHSEALLQDKSIDARELVRLAPGPNGTVAVPASDSEKGLIAAGYSVAEIMLPAVKPDKVEQLALFAP